mgnify:CR=1 FL=1
MSEVKIYYRDKEKIKVARSISALKELDKKDIIWIDLIDVSDKTEDTLEGFLKIDIQEDEEMEEINERLINYHGQEVEIGYYEDREIKTTISTKIIFFVSSYTVQNAINNN